MVAYLSSRRAKSLCRKFHLQRMKNYVCLAPMEKAHPIRFSDPAGHINLVLRNRRASIIAYLCLEPPNVNLRLSPPDEESTPHSGFWPSRAHTGGHGSVPKRHGIQLTPCYANRRVQVNEIYAGVRSSETATCSFRKRRL